LAPMDVSFAKTLLDGQSHSGDKIIHQHYNTIASLANCVKSTLGPYGLNKLMVDSTGETIISNDGNTILKQIQVDNPISKLLLDLANEQDNAVGDGTTSVTLIAAELLKACSKLVKLSVHPSSIIAGFKQACRQACKHLTKSCSFKINPEEQYETLLKVAKTSISSKIIAEESDFFAKLAIDTVLASKSHQTNTFAIDQVGIVKSVGRSINDTELFHGITLNCVKMTRDMPFSIDDAKIACIDFPLNIGKMRMGVQVLVTESAQLEGIRKKEHEMGLKAVKLIIESGANVVLCTNNIHEDYSHIFAEAGVMAVNHCLKSDVAQIAAATGASFVKSLSYQLNSSELTFDSSFLGRAKNVSQKRFADAECILITEPEARSSASLILRGPSPAIIEEVHRSLEDCFHAIKKAMESQDLIAGAGAPDISMAVYLEEYALTIDSELQIVVKEFANALKFIPTQLALNAGADATELVGNMIAKHRAALADPVNNSIHTGLDLENRTIFDAKKAGIIDPLGSKIHQLRKATEAVIIITKVDNVIRHNPKQEKDDGDHCY